MNEYLCSVLALQRRVRAAIAAGEINTALESVRIFVESVIADPNATGRLFADARVDVLCLEIGELAIKSMNLLPTALFNGAQYILRRRFTAAA